MATSSSKPSSNWIKAHKLLLSVALFIIVIAVVGVISVVKAPGSKVTKGVPANNTEVVKTGKVVCLPHKSASPDTPQTLECAMGLQDDASKYYGLKDEDSAPGQSPINDVMNKRVEVTGTFTQSSDTIYDIVGTISLKKLKVLE